MLQTAERGAPKSKKAPHERYLEAFRIMLQTRIFEEKLASLYRGGLITGGVYLGKGQEAVSVACGLFLQKGDVFAPLIRIGITLNNTRSVFVYVRHFSRRG